MPIQTQQSATVVEAGEQNPRHPLEPLSAAEIAIAVNVLKAQPVFTPTTRIVSIMLREPDKAGVIAWPEKQLNERHALAVLVDNGTNTAYSAELNLSASTLVHLQQAPAGSEPTLSMDEQIECEQAVLTSSEFAAKLKEHYGMTDPSLVMVDIWSAGNYGSEEDRTPSPGAAALLLAHRSDRQRLRPADGGSTSGRRSEHHEGAARRRLWPLAASAATRQLCRGSRRLRSARHQAAADYAAGRPSFSLDGQQLSWEKWEFVIGFNAPRRPDAPPCPLPRPGARPFHPLSRFA